MRKLVGVLVVVLTLVGVIRFAEAQSVNGLNITLSTTPFAAGVGLENVTGSAELAAEQGYVKITLNPNGAVLPVGTVLEGWLVDAGRNDDPALSSASDADEGQGASFGDANFKTALESVPYAQTTGVLTPNAAGLWEVVFTLPNANFSPFDNVVVTAESDGNVLTGFDPRPGTPVLVGRIAEGTASPVTPVMVESGSGIGLVQVTFAPAADLLAISGLATLDIASGMINVTLNGAALPAGSVLEAWLIDAGLMTNGPGISNATALDEVFGTPFGNVDLHGVVESNFYALSVGVVADQGNGVYQLAAQIPNYNFSPYDALLITLETDGNAVTGFDPRPGSPFLFGLTANAVAIASSETAVTNLPAWQTMTLRNASTGEAFTIGALLQEGRTVIIEPMATWCSNCRVQQGNVREVYNTLDPNLYTFISLSVETNLDDASLASYAINQDFDWTFAVASEELLAALVEQFGRSITSPPSTPHFVVRPDGTFSELLTGISSSGELTTWITGG